MRLEGHTYRFAVCVHLQRCCEWRVLFLFPDLALLDCCQNLVTEQAQLERRIFGQVTRLRFGRLLKLRCVATTVWVVAKGKFSVRLLDHVRSRLIKQGEVSQTPPVAALLPLPYQARE